jgi:hypothetical protein
MQDTKGNLDTTTSNKLVWCAMQCTLIKKETTFFSCATCLFKVSSFNDNSLSFPSIDVHIMHFTWDTKPSSPITRFNPSKLDYSKILKDPSLVIKMFRFHGWKFSCIKVIKF